MFFPDIAWEQILSDFHFRELETDSVKELTRSTEFNIAFSGGGDSLAALVFLIFLHRQSPSFRTIRIVYLEHQNSIPERNSFIKMILKEVSKERNLRVEFKKTEKNVAKISHKIGWSFERTGSILRHKLINGFSGFSVWGHNLSDWYETMVMRLPRGTSPEALSPAPIVKNGLFGKELRPLARMTRKEVRAWLVKYGFSWWDDPSNDDLKILRNKVRKLTDSLSGGGLRISYDHFFLQHNLQYKIIKLHREIRLPKFSQKLDWILALKALGMPHPSAELRKKIRPGFTWGPWSLLKENWNNEQVFSVFRGRRRCYGNLFLDGINEKKIQLKFGSKTIKKLFKEKWISSRQTPLIHFDVYKSQILKIDCTGIGGKVIFAQEKEFYKDH